MKINGKEMCGYKNKTEFLKETKNHIEHKGVTNAFDLNRVGGFCGTNNK